MTNNTYYTFKFTKLKLNDYMLNTKMPMCMCVCVCTKLQLNDNITYLNATIQNTTTTATTTNNTYIN